ncbi:Wzz/FepE/Etk N-terminal domain-containing protein [Alcaligenes faecalis subsp. phenolicus]|uniref:Wzz/FepE/Etk N-terminal domain-containing protein n=1 Tax=Alcaligenes nematophilus TaxID=2994643 RepID=UPI002AA3AC12|nr:Wzz/FepE/Etk N-terminal domain-containing protein [Alcaligenes phenolicus]
MNHAQDNRGRAVGSSQQLSADRVVTDDIDLRELIVQLWFSRGLIACVTMAAVVVAFVYAFFLAEEVYETRAIMLPPTHQHLAAYNLAYQATSGDVDLTFGRRSDAASSIKEQAIPGITVEMAYAVFQRHLSSMQLREQFFNTYYAGDAKNVHLSKERYRLWQSLQEAIRIELPGTVKGSPSGQTTLLWKGSDPDKIADWSNRYIDMAMQAAAAELMTNLNSELATRQAAVQVQLSILRQSGVDQQLYELARLREALRIADMIGLEDHLDSPKIWTDNLGDLSYVQGSKALKAQLDALEAREDIDSFLPEIPRLLRWQSLLSSLAAHPADVRVAEWDARAQAPAVPVSPRRALIVALGLVLGLMMGVCWALARHAFGVGERSHGKAPQHRFCTTPAPASAK